VWDSMLKEVTLAATMHHPNVVAVFGVCTIESTNEVWLVMEYGEEGSLYFYLSDYTKVKQFVETKTWGRIYIVFIVLLFNLQEISWNTRWRWATEAALAVAYLHEQGVIHRDIKSSNFVISKGSLKICDFGMSTISVASSVLSAGSKLPKVYPPHFSPLYHPHHPTVHKVKSHTGWHHTLYCS
jgi:serine/threonine protein kinase